MGFFRTISDLSHTIDPLGARVHDHFGIIKQLEPKTKLVTPDYEALYQSGALQKGENIPQPEYVTYKKGGKVKKSAPAIRGHGIETKGRTKGRFVR